MIELKAPRRPRTIVERPASTLVTPNSTVPAFVIEHVEGIDPLRFASSEASIHILVVLETGEVEEEGFVHL